MFWTLDNGDIIDLLTPKQLKSLPPYIIITSINGKTRAVYEDGNLPPDDDTRFGYTAWGIRREK